MRKYLFTLMAVIMLLGISSPLAAPALAAEPQLTLGVDGMICPI